MKIVHTEVSEPRLRAATVGMGPVKRADGLVSERPPDRHHRSGGTACRPVSSRPIPTREPEEAYQTSIPISRSPTAAGPRRQGQRRHARRRTSDPRTDGLHPRRRAQARGHREARALGDAQPGGLRPAGPARDPGSRGDRRRGHLPERRHDPLSREGPRLSQGLQRRLQPLARGLLRDGPGPLSRARDGHASDDRGGARGAARGEADGDEGRDVPR
jgi:hypothetical protein